MAKKKRKKAAADTTVSNGTQTTAEPRQAEGGKPESVAGYFRQVFKDNPKLLKERSNQPLLDRWLGDHPDQTEVPKAVKTGLANLKSVLRSKGRKKAAERKAEDAGSESHGVIAPRLGDGNALEALEQQIDECLTLARTEDRQGLASVIGLLRRARNEVVWKMGQ